MKINPLTTIDFYKADHRRQYPEGTEMVYSNFTPRSLKHAPSIKGITDDKVVFFGLQYFIKWFLMDVFNEEFFKQPLEKVVARYKRRMDNALGPDTIPMEHIIGLHDIGYVPVSIRALPEGARVNAQVPVFTIRNTHESHPTAFWITNYLETVLSSMCWLPCTSATIAHNYRQLLDKYALDTVGDVSAVQFQAHDFSCRGMGGVQASIMSGAAHLLSFAGTDTVAAIDFLEDYYGADSDKELIGCSVPATEHSVMCMGGQEDELGTFRRLITELYPKGIVSIVSDTWDFWRVITEYLPALKTDILARSGGYPVDKVVIRPDSGDPVKIITGLRWIEVPKDTDVVWYWTLEDIIEEGTPQSGSIIGYLDDIEAVRKDGVFYEADVRYDCDGFVDHIVLGKELPEHVVKGAVECLWDTFGGTVTDKGYKLLDSHIGLIYGDSITLKRAHDIVERLKLKGFASTNVVLGVGLT